MDATELIDAGLTKNQAEIYLELLKHPGQTGGEVAKRLSIDRSFAYNILNALVDKGLVSHVIKGNVKLFYSNDPQNLLRDLDEKRGKINSIIAGLEKVKDKSKPENFVTVYEGKSGLKAYILELMNSSSFSTLGGGGKLRIFDVLKYDYPQYLKKMESKKITGRLITSPGNKKELGEMYKKLDSKIKTLDSLKSDVSFTIFDSRLAIYSAEEKPFVVMIESKNISDAMRNYFEELWKLSKE